METERLLKPGEPKKRLNVSNGYVEISEARRIIEGSYYEQERQNEGI